MNLRTLPAHIAEEAYRRARLEKLCREPFTPDRLGLYAFLLQMRLPDKAVAAYLFDENNCLLHRRVLRASLYTPETYCALLPGIFREQSAARLGLSVCAADRCEPQITDILQLSRAALYCEEQGIPVLDMILLHENGYIPLSRADGGEQLFQMKLF